MKRIVLAAAAVLCSLTALAAQGGQGFSTRVLVRAGIGTVQDPDAYVAGEETIFTFRYDSLGDFGFSVFDPPDGKAFMVAQKAGITLGKGTFVVAVPTEQLKGVTGVTCLIDPPGQRGTVFFQLTDGVNGLKKTSIPSSLVSQVVRAGPPQDSPGDGAKPPFVARVDVPADMAVMGPPVLFTTGTETVFSIPYDSHGEWSVLLFNPPDGDRFRIEVPQGIHAGQGALTFAVPNDTLAGVTEATCLIDYRGRRARVLFRIEQDPSTLPPSPIPVALAAQVIRKTASEPSNQTPGVTKERAAFLVTMPQELATMGTPTMFSTGTEVIFDFPYDSQGTWNATFSHPKGVFSISADSGMKKGLGSLTFGVPLATLQGLDQVFFSVYTPRLQGEIAVRIGQEFKNLPVRGVPAEVASRVIRKSTKTPRSLENPILTPMQESASAISDLPPTKPGAKNLVGKNRDPRLVGRWREVYTAAQVAFYPDGTSQYVESRLNVQDQIAWSTRTDNVLIETNNTPGGPGRPVERPYALRGGHLLISDRGTSVAGERFLVVHEYEPYPE